MDDTNINTYNPTFETLYKLYTRQQHTLTPYLINAEPITQKTHNHYTHSQNNSTRSDTNTPPGRKRTYM
jgi:hypothetical protein